VYPVKEKKSYAHITELMTIVLEKRIADATGFHRQQDLEEGDPRRLARNIASVPPPPTAELAEQKVSRF
jgi:hypothetical protein